MNFDRHPLSAAFPDMGQDDLHALAIDIKANGQREAIVLCEGKVLDGWHRYSGCLIADVEPVMVELPEEIDPVSYVLSRNLHRRHMTESQRALAIVECRKWAPSGMNQHTGGVAPGASPVSTNASMAKEAEVGERTISDAKVVSEKASPEVKDAVRKGKLSVKKGAAIAKGKKPVAPARKKAAAPAAPATPPGDVDKPADDPLAGLPTLSELNDELTRENETLQALVKAAEADDQKAETLKWRKLADVAQRRQGELQDVANKAQQREKWTMDQLRRCGKAVGEEDPAKIARAVETAIAAAKAAV